MRLARGVICVVAIAAFAEMMLENSGSEPIDWRGVSAFVRDSLLLLCILGYEGMLTWREYQDAQA